MDLGIKIPCVRCGKMIEPTKTYCSDCEREMSGQPRTGGGRKSFRIIIFLVLILAAAEAYYLTQPAKEELPKATKSAEKSPKVETKAPLASTPKASTPSPDKIESNGAGSNPVAAKPGQNSGAGASTSSGEQSGANAASSQTASSAPSGAGAATASTSMAPVEPVPPAPSSAAEGAQGVAAPQPVKPVEPEPSKPEPKTASAPPAAPINPAVLAQAAKADTLIWVFYQKKTEADRRMVEEFKKLGFVNVHAKGRWEGNYRDQNIFYRTDDKKPVQALAAQTPTENFQAYNYKSERIAGRIKELFKKNGALEYLVIVH